MVNRVYSKKLYVLRYVINSRKSVIYTICTGLFAKHNKKLIVKEFKANGKGEFHLMGERVKNRKQTRNEKTALKWLETNKESEARIENPSAYNLANYNNLLI